MHRTGNLEAVYVVFVLAIYPAKVLATTVATNNRLRLIVIEYTHFRVNMALVTPRRILYEKPIGVESRPYV
jgi:hypothetical protein